MADNVGARIHSLFVMDKKRKSLADTVGPRKTPKASIDLDALEKVEKAFHGGPATAEEATEGDPSGSTEPDAPEDAVTAEKTPKTRGAKRAKATRKVAVASDDTLKLSAELDAALFQRMKLYCVSNRITIRAYLESLIRKDLGD